MRAICAPQAPERGAAVPPFPTIPALHAAYAGGHDPRATVAAVYRRLAAIDDPGIFITLVPEAEALAAAAALGAFDPAGRPLWGVPFAVKDNVDVAGLPTTAACPDFAYMPSETAPAVARLLAAGAILIGKTNLDQFATGLVGLRTPHPAPRNAIDPAIVPGGSSSGSAVAVAHGIVSFAVGTDTAGSGRVPAGLNNVVGLKPSLGAVSSRGMLPACRTLDTLSVFAGTVADADAAFRVMADYDPADPWSRALPVASAPAGLPPGLRLGVPDTNSRRFGGDILSEAAFDATLADLEGLAGLTEPVDLAPMFATAALLYDGPWVAERYAAIRAVMETRPDILHPITRAVIASAERHGAADAFAGLYRLAELRRATDRVWDRVDVIAVPTYPRPRTCADLEADPIGPNSELGTYTNFVNLLDWCALAVPGRFRSDGLPAGITLLAPRGGDGLLAVLGARLQAAAAPGIGAGTTPVPAAEAAPARARPDEIELAVVGAHLSGLPLNRELTERGARFIRAAETGGDYRLYALSGGPPQRPGLLRVAAGTGAAIEAEVWALPAAGFGAFVAGIPAPLGIGTLVLADGTRPKGFLVEAAGIDGAADITRFGGWRRYLAARAAA
ncbi:allophanate hydrolase [Methylobacterium sp. NEAU 140]|uniref:allophanate hydrolase n=1 Tax=Methylobacterium sp. NEAU 140 TaxID=3064945 RepID=UPI00273454A1|nr:allophanate hydrolase [Methylobacterium sp. NEAU 140]MDP4021918.1 allophanate hydrolase [Methylobacterium sp. NEAU 140]